MALITERKQALDIYSEAAGKRWVMPCFRTENLTTTEAVLSAVLDYSHKTGQIDLPIIIAITNCYLYLLPSEYYF